jgi:hypothetical protein
MPYRSANVGHEVKNGKMHQQWEVVYLKDMPKEPTKGMLSKNYGLIVERPFYVISGLKSGKYLDIVGRNMVIKTRNGRNTQLWYFDQRSRTIKNW